MTREDKLYSMRMQELEIVALKLGIKINKKAAKSKAIEKILKAENQNAAPTACQPAKPVDIWEKSEKDTSETDQVSAKSEEIATPATESKQQLTPKRGALIEYNGKSQNICAWAKELGKSANTLYARIYKLGWSVEKAFTM